MKLILIHGNFQDAAIKKLSEIKKNFDPLAITEVSSSTGGLNFATPSLFSEKRLVILENPDINAVEQVINQEDNQLTVIIKFSKTLEKSSAVYKKVLEERGEVMIFDETVQTSIFPLLDLLGNKNKRTFLEFEKNYTQMGGQYILTMLAYFLRRMVARPKSASDFMRQKIQTQKKNFNSERIEELYREIIETDFKIKQGFAEEKLAVTLLVQKILN